MKSKDKAKILVVDDEPRNVRLLEANLIPEGYEVITAYDGKEALNKVSENEIDLILLDVMMPEIDGFEVTRRLRVDKKTHLLPIVLVTALKETEDRIKGIEAGCNDFISKPFDKSELMARVRSMLALKYAYDEIERTNKQLEELSLTDPLTGVYNRRYLMDRIEAEIKRSTRTKSSISCIITDVDHFKNFNDEHGHPFGDFIVEYIANFLRRNIRQSDVLTRYGGDEFFIIAPDMDKENASLLANKFSEKLEGIVLLKGDISVRLTISSGISSFDGASFGKKIIDRLLVSELREKLINDADKALYKAKEGGRNRVCVSSFDD